MTLQPGDILLWRVDPKASVIDRLIGWGERHIGDQRGDASYFHVGFVSTDTGWFYQSKPPKIQLSPVPDPFPPYLERFRLKVAPAADQLRLIFKYADSRLGRPYDFLGVLSAGWIELGELEFCSQYTEDSFIQGGIVLTPDVKFSTPDDIAVSSLLARVDQ